ncbi:hypothetical protein CBG53_00965 [Porphyromonas gingivalis]|uniref:undecaprenyl diphosphate synthase family protein n=1 Tax=Bacteroidales TaxID=171549 RepID=UPI0003AD34FD|nr:MULTISPECIES: undecaprenyl diphosphate synthase family protein [Bacteroidales]ERJ69749.1 putative undecaprenyl diphosphate synthase [Porphyromonas gingivalis F0569]OWP34501.1 hypothetical protein CBG53_00965 [Porphyromonas gingivalis]OWR77826.1 hypothetical protein SJDPG11_07225 [Porphyromonas gingivalis SJD11]RRC97455.1 hypothetical protein EII32_10500 [Prevotella sp. OH937_COT-195]
MKDIFENYHPSREIIPNHVALIPDGSRRWAVKKGMSYYESYDLAMRNLCQIIEFLYDRGVSIISVYFSSSQNFERPMVEVEAFCKAESNFCNIHILPVVEKNNVHVDFFGNKSLLPQYFLDSLIKLKLRTRDCVSKQLNLCVAYNPFVELLESSLKSNSPTDLLNNLWISTPVDLIIRTGNANLLSNFLLLQSGFARLYFPDKLINDICKKDIEAIIDEFCKIERKYGE